MGLRDFVLRTVPACWWVGEKAEHRLDQISSRNRIWLQPDECCHHPPQKRSHYSR